MSMIKWRGNDLDTLFSDMDNTFNSIFDNDFFSHTTKWIAAPLSAVSRKTFRASASETNMTLAIDVPGVKATDLTVETQGHELSISAKREDYVSTYRYMIHETYDMTSLKASLEDGVLTLVLDAKPELQPRKVEVTVVQK